MTGWRGARETDRLGGNKYRMEQSGLTIKDFVPVIGGKNRVNGVLSRRRSLTLRMVAGLHTKLGIPPESLFRRRPVSQPKRPVISFGFRRK